MMLILAALAAQAMAEISLDSIQRQIFKQGLHRELQTNITYTVTQEADLKHCSFVVRENITKDHYIYYEEVTRDMPGF